MTAATASFEFAFVLGAAVAAVVLWLVALAPARRERAAGLATAERLAADVTSLRVQLATEEQRCASLRASEGDVEARLQRVAKAYVDEARDVLVKAAGERFDGQSAALRERVGASLLPLSERLEQLGASLSALGTERTKDQERVSTLLVG